MSAPIKTVTVFGGTGFIGRQIVQALAKHGWAIRIAGRVPERAYDLKPCGTPGQIVPIACDGTDPESIAAALRGADYAVNCIGILYERRKGDFYKTHVDIPASIARACAEENVERLVHISTLGVDTAESRYARTKRDGEEALHATFPKATILRPSVVFGPDDEFFNLFAKLSNIFPALPLVGGGETKFQPVYVGDVAHAAEAALTQADTQGKVYELGGPEILNFKEIYDRLFECTGQERALISLPWGMAKIQATFLSILPGKPLLTCDQVDTLKTDNVVSEGANTLESLGITPTGMNLILPTYLESYRSGGRFADKEAA